VARHQPLAHCVLFRLRREDGSSVREAAVQCWVKVVAMFSASELASPTVCAPHAGVPRPYSSCFRQVLSDLLFPAIECMATDATHGPEVLAWAGLNT